MRCGTGVHTHHESLSPAPPDQFPACRSGHPCYASDVAHTPTPQRSDTRHRSRRDDLRPDRLPRPALSRRHRGCRMRLHPIEPVQPRDFPVLRAAAQHLALPAMPHAQPARAQVQQRTLQTLLPALRPAQPVAHMAVFFGRSLTMSRKAVRLPLHPARRTCVWAGCTPERECPATPPFPSPGMRRSAARKVLAVSFSFAPATNARLRSRSTNTSQNGKNNALPNAALKRQSSPSRKYPASNSVSDVEHFVFAPPVNCAAPPSKTKTLP